MKTRTYPAMMAMLVGVASLSTSQASVIAYFCDGTANDAAALTSVVTPLGVTVTTLTYDVGFNGDGAENITRTSFADNSITLTTPAGPTAGSSADSEWLSVRSNYADNGGPVSTTDYFGFTITANVGNTLSLNTFKFDQAIMNTAGSTTGVAALFVSVNGGTFTNFGSQSITQATAAVSPVSTQIIDLSSITGANSVEFRLNVSDNRGVTAASHIFQGLQLDATVIPEPSTMALLLGGVALLAVRRRRM